MYLLHGCALLNRQHGFIKRYQVSDKDVIQIITFTKHQAPHGAEKDSELPDEDGYLTVYERGKSGIIDAESAKKVLYQPNDNSYLTVK
jgi:hypothetical protein